MDEKVVSTARGSVISWLGWLREADPKAVKFNDPEVEALQSGVSETALDLFGRDSMEFERFCEFRVCHGNWSMMDPPSEKQTKFERGIPKAIADLEDLIGLIDSLQPSTGEASSETVIMDAEIVSTPNAGKKQPKEQRAAPAAAPRKPVKEKAAAPVNAHQKPGTKPGQKVVAPAKNAVEPTVRGKVLLLHSGDNEMTLNVIDILDRLNIDTAIPDNSGEDSISGLGGIAERQDARFALFLLSADERTLFGALPGKIVKGKSRLSDIFELGFLAGKLGPGNVGLIFRKDKGLEVPPDLFGINYVPFEDGGGWKISLVKLLKSAGFNVDANVLFE